MQKISGLSTKDGKPIYMNGHIEELRAVEEEKRKSKTPSRIFISQTGAQEHVQHSSADVDGTGGNRGGGKANTYNTPVVTPAGFRKMGDLEEGDLICTPYEGVQKVEAIFEQGENTVYSFHFDDGTESHVMDNHRFWARENDLEPFHVMTAREIMKHYVIDRKYPISMKHNSQAYLEIPLCGEVKMNEDINPVDLPLHPFVLGYISCTGFWEFGYRGLLISNSRFVAVTFKKYGYRIWRERVSGNYYLRGLTDYNRLKITGSRNKQLARIPDIYMTASIESRWQYLKGLMFTAGKSAKKHPYISFPNKHLAQQVAQMARSLGMWVKISEEQDEVDKVGFWRVSFIAPNDKEMFVNQSRALRAHVNAEIPTSPDCQGVLTKKILWVSKCQNKAKCRCIQVSGDHHLYLTDGFTINHNTVMLLTKPAPDFSNKYFNGIVFRKNKGDFENIINETKKWYEPFGRYNRSADDMTWNFNYGSHLSFSYFDMPYQDFDDKYRGQQFAYIGIDEVPQMSFKMFKFLTTCNRNTNNIKSRMLFTCNPDPLSWLRKFLDWYIGKETTVYADGKTHPERKGFVIPERSGRIRYFYSPDDSVDNIIWGNSPHEVYLQIKDIADAGWNDALAEFGHTRETYLVKSFRFTKADLLDNKALMALDEDYIKNLYQQPPEVRARELEGNWDIIRTGDDMIQPYHLEQCFHNAQMLGDKIRRASCDVAGSGGDNCVTWFRIGNHIQDVFVCRRDPYTTIPLIKAKLKEWGVNEQNFTYDLQGMGQVFTGAFPNAVPFNNQEACTGDERKMYDCLKSQAAYLFAQHTQQAEWSIESTLLDREYKVGNVTMRLYNILQSERKAIRQDMSKQDRGWCLIHKEQMKHKSLVGHSPDFIEALMMFEVFSIKNEQVEIPSFLSSHVRHRRVFAFK